MAETQADRLRGYQAQEKRFVEPRFPLRFEPENPVIRELYNQSKTLRWNPEDDVPWTRLDPEAYPPDVRDAARLTWSRRAWGAYPGVGESTALLIRFCLESGATGMDAKLFLSFRPAEEAKHLETCYLFAERLGGYEADPGQDAVALVSNRPFAQMALDPDVPPEAFVAALGCLDDQLDLDLCVSHLRQSRDEVARQILRLIAGDKQRHVLFAWTLLGDRLPRLAAERRPAVAAAVRDVLERAVLSGYRNTWLLPAGARDRLLDAEALTARHGLGASTVEQEKRVLRATIAQVRERLAALDVVLPFVTHPEVGRL
jgi:hypothetical protein